MTTIELPLPSERVGTAEDPKAVIFQNPVTDLFPAGYQLIPQLNEVYELHLAAIEARHLTAEALVERGAYFQSIQGTETKHYQLCLGDPLSMTTASDRRRMFFSVNLFKTGYATHGLFPYRGKFHPQMVKALLNAMGLHPGETVLDPMMGSGTTLIEAATMGINAIGYDVSPLCTLMTRAKVDALNIDPSLLSRVVDDPELLDQVFAQFESHPVTIETAPLQPVDRIMSLAYYDAVGFANRSTKVNRQQAFTEVLTRYTQVIQKFATARERLHLAIGIGYCECADARVMPLPDASVDGILFSPPYSFAVDYIENDITQLHLMGVDVPAVRGTMVGLRGRKGVEQVRYYQQDMTAVLRECHRVLRPTRYCVIVVGTNERQLNALRAREELQDLEASLEAFFIRIGTEAGFRFTGEIRRQVTGIANSLREESILIFQKA
ncbi:MAG: TRM11 family SAM-dependent methyltransferase [Armatimonadota bacterium]